MHPRLYIELHVGGPKASMKILQTHLTGKIILIGRLTRNEFQADSMHGCEQIFVGENG